MDPPEGEMGLILVLAGSLSLHHWDRLLGGLPLAPSSLESGPWLPRLAWSSAALALPAAAMALAWGLSRWRRGSMGSGTRPRSRLRLALYAGLPLLWGLMLADHLPLGMAEGGKVLPVSLSSWRPDLAGFLPFWCADGHVIAFCQTLVVLLGAAGTVVLVRRLLQPTLLPWLGMASLTLALAGVGRWLVAGTA